jgi:hypothetical protein
MGVMDEVVTWQEVADRLPSDVVAAILAGPPPPAHVRLARAVADWWNRPRGTAAVLGNSYSSTIRIMLGTETPGLDVLNDYATRRRG